MKTFAAIILGKFIFFLTRKLKIGGGSAAPGLFALRIDPELVEGLSKHIPQNIIITGTNGKTTTARILAHLARESELKVVSNHTGSNLERGIASTLISALHPGVKYDLGVWELDESAFNIVAPKIKPDIVVFLNISRDQLDRYGEIDKVVLNWCRTVAKLDPKTIVLINADDPNLQKLKKHFQGKVEKFGKKNITNIKTNGLNGSTFQFTINHKLLTINLPLPGLYHIYDAIAALVVTHYLGLPISKSLKDFQPAFGRSEKLPFGYIFLIKNPAGATQIFETLVPEIKEADRLLLVLNDNLADGTDVSWIWDVDFESSQNPSRAKSYFDSTQYDPERKSNGSRDLTIIVSGSRAQDLALRLKYAGFDPNNIIVENSLKNALKQARGGLEGQLYILPTYTAMLQLQGILAKSGIKKNYWEEL